jgi:hypothetical protein
VVGQENQLLDIVTDAARKAHAYGKITEEVLKKYTTSGMRMHGSTHTSMVKYLQGWRKISSMEFSMLSIHGITVWHIIENGGIWGNK